MLSGQITWRSEVALTLGLKLNLYASELGLLPLDRSDLLLQYLNITKTANFINIAFTIFEVSQ
jgi:hypothetical protein